VVWSDFIIAPNASAFCHFFPDVTLVSLLRERVMTQTELAQIALAVLGSIGAVYSLAELGSWRRRQGLEYIDGTVTRIP